MFDPTLRQWEAAYHLGPLTVIDMENFDIIVEHFESCPGTSCNDGQHESATTWLLRFFMTLDRSGPFFDLACAKYLDPELNAHLVQLTKGLNGTITNGAMLLLGNSLLHRQDFNGARACVNAILQDDNMNEYALAIMGCLTSPDPKANAAELMEQLIEHYDEQVATQAVYVAAFRKQAPAWNDESAA